MNQHTVIAIERKVLEAEKVFHEDLHAKYCMFNQLNSKSSCNDVNPCQIILLSEQQPRNQHRYNSTTCGQKDS